MLGSAALGGGKRGQAGVGAWHETLYTPEGCVPAVDDIEGQGKVLSELVVAQRAAGTLGLATAAVCAARVARDH